MPTLNADYFEANPEEFAKLTGEQQDLIIQGEEILGDSIGEETTTEVKEPEVTDSPEKEETQVDGILAKDGKHYLPFEVLQQERQTTQELKTQLQEVQNQASQMQSMLAELQQAKEDDAGTGTTEAQQDVLAKYEGFFPDIAEDLKPYIEAMIAEGIEKGSNAKLKDLEARLDQVQEAAYNAWVESERNAHFKAIADKIPDHETIADSKEFLEWKDNLPGYLKEATQKVFEQGTAQQVIEMYQAFKRDTGAGKPKAVEETVNLKAEAENKISGIKKPVPGSLGDIPTGVAGEFSAEDEILKNPDATPAQLERLFMGKTSKQIDQMLAKVL